MESIEIVKHKLQPSSEDYLWKYMSLHKFLSFIIGKRFYYARLDQLEDSREGISQRHLSMLKFHMENKIDGLLDVNHPSYRLWFDTNRLTKSEKKFVNFQKSNFVTCWFVNARESAGMWNLYSEPGGVAVKMRADFLIKHLRSWTIDIAKVDGKIELSYGSVEYRDFSDRLAMEQKKFLVKNPVFRKDLSFEHEREFRASIRLENPVERFGFEQVLQSFDTVPFEIVCHPKTPLWQKNSLSEVLAKFGPGRKLVDSELSLR